MVLSFFRGGDDALENVDHEVTKMLGDCRHSLDLALSALYAEGDITQIGEEVRATDQRINGSEEAVRRDLLVHTTVHGSGEVAVVLNSLLVVKKLERVGDQAKNIFDLADEGVRFAGAADGDELASLGIETSGRLGEAATIMAASDTDRAETFMASCVERMDDLDRRVNALIHSDEPARYAVPRAMYFRYLKRITANTESAVSTLVRPLTRAEIDIDE